MKEVVGTKVPLSYPSFSIELSPGSGGGGGGDHLEGGGGYEGGGRRAGVLVTEAVDMDEAMTVDVVVHLLNGFMNMTTNWNYFLHLR
ncbi:hypothetical protein L6452_37246 [Arctium lappa]|uniref:Uncharacterized protein n=1 Tax=Arctium lappa TaxID=4217 RepID=A0ACB8Y2G8_ARCLA|nr:hypothetical protein L6452_37246 [Arctium lappa]